ncbi:glycosyltransferase family 39 protein [Undibacterium sp. Jales W-56]|uniref:glycosyltransferase family 39 protein n=1 Tax=Undibacterium sp. Jales W-56 TaxID=2897325 RepID=UPI0021CFB259|nr:glycosyltransferase family 39 protein [Undibacterium sp. Jales W-56]MCU6433395.1 glycosyltransferase family 39 protein [Undibacterium sp. Jales W-56]
MKQHRSPYDSPTTLWLIALVFLLAWLYMLGARTLVPTDEGRYAEMAREMVATGDWITLRLNGIKYFEKPPLQNWMNAISFELFGLGEWQARLWTGLCGLLGIAVTAYAGFKVFNRRIGISAALILGSSFLWFGLGHINTLDMGLSGMMTLSLCGLLLAQRPDASAAEQRYGMLLCWVGMALASMSKGPIGLVLPGAALVIYTLATRDWALWSRLHLGKGLLVFFVITAPWFILVWQKNPEHPYFFFIHENFQRFTSKVHHREGAWYYFFPILILGILPWLGLLLQGLWSGLREQATSKSFQPKKMLLIWSVFIFVFFSMSGSKLPSYILPIFPALALLIAAQLERASLMSLRVTTVLFGLLGLAGLIFAGKVGGLTTLAYEIPLYQAYEPWAYAAAAIALAGGALATYLVGRNKDAAVLTLAVASFIAWQALFLGHEPLGRYSAGLQHVAAIQAELTPTTPIYAVGRYEQALPFYLQRTLILVEHPDEMEFGLQQQPELWIPKRADFVAKWRDYSVSGKAAVAIIRTDIYEKFVQEQVPMRVIGQDPRRVIVSNLLTQPTSTTNPAAK